MATFRFTAGPWNIHEGNETFGPGHRKSIGLEEKIKKFAEIGLSGVQFHDDDAVPDMNNMTEKQIIDYAKDVKAMLDKYGLFAEFVAPRLWFDPRTNDGGFTASRKEDREFAQWRARRSCDIAKVLALAPEHRFPAAYRYENAKGQRFLVYAFRAESQEEKSGMYWSYGRGAQLGREIPWLGGCEVPALCVGHPYLYCRCNADEKGIAAAFFNYTVDGISQTTVRFDRDLASVRVLGGTGKQRDARTVELSDIRGFGYVAIEAEYC